MEAKMKMQNMKFPQSSHHPSNVEVTPQSAIFHPSVWGDYFISLPPMPSSQLDLLRVRHDELKDEVMETLMDTKYPLHLLELIDRIQRLGVAYLFEEKIHNALHKFHMSNNIDENDIYTVSLLFRLLRQERYHASSDVFQRFLNEKGEFHNSLTNNVKTLLSLYEASQWSMPDEDILDQASKFSKNQLIDQLSSCKLEPHLAMMVSRALEAPLVRRVDRTRTKQYLSIYENDKMCNKVLLKFAKVDFLLLQALHQDELRSLSIWWKELDIKECLPSIRDRIVECYFWILSVYFEPSYSRARMMMTKTIKILSITDDIYDTFGTIEELRLLTDIIESWELEDISKLPKYMQSYFLKIYNTFKSFEDELAQENNSFRVQFLIKQFKLLSRCYFEEAKWASEGHVPSLKDHLKVSLTTSGYSCLSCASYIGMKDVITLDLFEWVTSIPPIITSICFIVRIMNDIVAYKDEQSRTHEHVASTVQCYVMEHECSEEQACLKLMEMVDEKWKDLNREFIFSKPPVPLIRPIINLSLICELLYREKDNYTNSDKNTKDNIIAVLVEPIHVNMMV